MNNIYEFKLIDNSEMNSILSEYISNVDIDKYMGKMPNKIIKYSDLDNYKLLDLLPKNKSYFIILSEDTYNSGHWVACMRYGRTIEYFDSYGEPPSYYIGQLDADTNKELEHYDLYLNDLLNEALLKGFNVIYNKKKFQELKEGIGTCGKHVLTRIIMMKRMNYNLKDYQRTIQLLCNKYNINSDKLVSYFIPKLD